MARHAPRRTDHDSIPHGCLLHRTHLPQYRCKHQSVGIGDGAEMAGPSFFVIQDDSGVGDQIVPEGKQPRYAYTMAIGLEVVRPSSWMSFGTSPSYKRMAESSCASSILKRIESSLGRLRRDRPYMNKLFTPSAAGTNYQACCSEQANSHVSACANTRLFWSFTPLNNERPGDRVRRRVSYRIRRDGKK